MDQTVFDIVPLKNISLPITSNSSCLCQSPAGWGPVDNEFNFTPCFIEGVLYNIPNLILIVFGSYQLYSISSHRPHPGSTDWFFILKLALVVAQIALFLLYSLARVHFSEAPINDIFVLSPLVSFASLFIALSLHYVEHFRSLIPSGSLLFYWLFEILVGSIKVFSLYSHGAFTNDSHHTILLLLPIFILSNSVIVFFLEWLVPKARMPYARLDEYYPNRSPLEMSDIFSKITFAWMTPLMKKGYETFLTAEDLPELPKEDTTAYISSQFAKNWQQQLSSKKNPSLTIALGKTFGGLFLTGGFFKVIQDILAFTQPQLLRLLIKFVTDYSKGKDVNMKQGFAIAIGMFLVSIVQTAALHQYFQRVFEVGMKLKASLTAAIYQKSLVLSTEDRAQKTTGDIVNLMSVDTQRLQDLTQYGQTLWSGPFQIILCLVSLHNLLGPSMWAGVVIMIIMIPVNATAAKYQKSLQAIQMKNKDSRTRLTNELLTNIKSLKLYGWEIPFTEKLMNVRDNMELKTLKKIGIFMSLINFLWSSTPYFVSCSTFAIYVLTSDKPLTTDIVFPALNLFNLLTFPLAVFPMVISSLIEAQVAVSRLTNFFTMDEVQPDSVIHLEPATAIGEESVVIDNATFLWQRKNGIKVALSDVNFKAYKGSLSCIVGKVGSGKSAFLQAILGDLHKSEGTVTVKGHVSYVAQVPWIMNATVKENILFGARYDHDFYQQTIEACALADDLAILPDGDATTVGEKGISLSGGQKARLSLARAVYARADVYLLDDVLSAVDEHVGAHIIKEVLGEEGLLASKTRILCTNSIPVLSHADYISMVSDGRIVETGTRQEIAESKGQIFQLIKDFGKKKATSTPSSSASSTVAPSSTSTPRLGSEDGLTDNESQEGPVLITSDIDAAKNVIKRRASNQTLRRASMASFKHVTIEDDEVGKRTRMQKEHMEQGQVKWDVYKEYAKACNPIAVAFFFFFLVASSAFSVASGFWLKHWSEKNTETGSNEHIGLYLGVYFAICISTSLSSVIYTLILMIGCSIQAAQKLHHRMLLSVIRAPMSFFETTPLGRILNRFSNDIYRIDQLLARVFSQFFSNSIYVCFTLCVIIYNTPPFAILVIPLGLLYLMYQRYYLRTSRELKRLDSVSKSPIYAHFQETLGGISTIRAYGQQDRFSYINESSMDLNLAAYFPSVSANRWLAVRLEFLGSIIILCASGLSIAMIRSGNVTAGTIGLAMSYALQITQSLNWIVRMTVEVETNIVSVERVLEYSNLPSEAPAIIEDHRPRATWPENGLVRFDHYYTKYRPELDYVLKDINVEIKPQEKIGIVGRTGAGKSSLTMALFRIIEPTDGHIEIDSLNTSTIGLADLRHRLSIIPQDSQVFEGTLRENLDPNNEHDDTELWRVLELAHLKDHVTNNMENKGLESVISEGGSNFSVGQRQLLSIARALLTPSKILVLDEATAAVDVHTDKLIQETIRQEFKDRTILTIAHRLNTIADSDRIMVLSEGKVVEFASPQELLSDKNSVFYSLAAQGGLINNENETSKSD